MKKIFQFLSALAFVSIMLPSCDKAGVGVPFPKEPRIEYEQDGYEVVIGEDTSTDAFVLRWTNEPSATYKVFLSSVDSEEVRDITSESSLAENDVRVMIVKMSDLVAYAAQLGYEVTSTGITSINGGTVPNSVSFRINVSAFDKNGNEFTQPAVYTRFAPVVLVPHANL